MARTQFVVLLFLFFAACASSEKNPDRSFAERLSGDSYESANSIEGIPAFNKEAPLKRKITGHVYCPNGFFQTLVNNAQISILDKQETLASVSTDSSGQYSFLAPLQKKKTYQLRAVAKCGRFEEDFVWSEASQDRGWDLFLKDQ